MRPIWRLDINGIGFDINETGVVLIEPYSSSFHRCLRCPTTGVKGKWVKIPRGPATVYGEPASQALEAAATRPGDGEGEKPGNDP